MYKDMCEYFKNSELGNFKISKYTIEKNNFQAMITGIPPGEYVKLTHNGEVMMSNTPMEKKTNDKFVFAAHGDILIAGLGIGLIILSIQDKERVSSITVIEKSPEVIELVAKQIPLNNKIKIINADIFEWKPEAGMKYDTIYFDIWNYINSDIYEEEMKPLKQKFRKYLKSKKDNPEGFISCWAEYEARNNLKLI